MSTTIAHDKYEKEHQKIELRKTLDRQLDKFDSLVTEILSKSDKKVHGTLRLLGNEEIPIPEPIFSEKKFAGKTSVSQVISFESRMYHNTTHEVEVVLSKSTSNSSADAVLKINVGQKLPDVYSKAVYEAARQFPDTVEMGAGRKYQIVITQSTVGFRL
ncbi:MAG TPA: hypothetical protein VND15_00660 [Candidatus Acidoferrales bacterium]|nr:hypothetical protein [Candidatus Acidoferrales bacterium]